MYKKRPQGWSKHLDFIVLELICLHVSFFLAYFTLNGGQNPLSWDQYYESVLLISLIDVFVTLFFETFKNVTKRGYYREFVMTLRQVVLVELITVFFVFAHSESHDYPKRVIYYLGCFHLVISYFARILWKVRLRNMFFSRNINSLVIVTSNSMIEQVAKDIKEGNYNMFQLTGIVVLDADMVGRKIAGAKVIANRDTVVDYICREWVDEILINLPENGEYPDDLVSKFIEMGIVIHRGFARYKSEIGEKQFVERIGNYTVLTTSINYATPRSLLAKRVLDIVFGIIGCLFTGVLVIILGPMIYIQSPGPIFFSQVRLGKNGKRFKIYKFRSMYMDAEERKKELLEQNRVKDGMMFKLEYDPRIIGCKKRSDGTFKKGIGNFIRDWSLDEFPQFFNVLMGDMSIVGTRPPTVDEWEKYELHHRARLATKPGITGMWQVSGRNNITDFEEIVKLDKQYISEWSFALDLQIILKTVAVVFRREGAM